jgi:hypothetical protein
MYKPGKQIGFNKTKHDYYTAMPYKLICGRHIFADACDRVSHGLLAKRTKRPLTLVGNL